MSRRTEGNVESYTLKDGKVRWSIRYLDRPRLSKKEREERPLDRPRKAKRERGFSTEREAEKALRQRLSEVEKYQYVEPSAMPYQGYAEKWLDSRRADLAPGTYKNYSGNQRLHVFPVLGNVPLQRLTKVMLNDLYTDLLNNGRVSGNGGLSARSVRMVHGVIAQVLSQAVEDDLLLVNVADKAKLPKVHEKHIEVWSAADISRFLVGTRENRRYPLWRLYFTTGLRRGEALGLRWDDLDLDATPPTLTVYRSLVDVEWGKPIIRTTKTKRGARRVTLDPDTAAILRRLRAEQAREKLLLGSGYTDHGLVFCHETGKPYHPDRTTKYFQEQTIRLGLPRIPLHDTRHASASHLLANGTPVHVVQRRLGHSTAAITLNHYAHVMPGQDEAAANTIDALLADPDREAR